MSEETDTGPEAGQEVATLGTPSTESAEVNEVPSWNWDSETPGAGDKPEWLREKYGSVSEQAKAYVEIEKRLGMTRAPEEYDMTKYDKFFDLENEHVVKISTNAKRHNVSQDVVDDLLDPIIKYHESLIPSQAAEMEKLGAGAQNKIDTINTWATNTLSDDSLDAMAALGSTAKTVKLFDEIRQKFSMTESQPPGTMQNLSTQKVETEKDVMQEIITNYSRYEKDGAYRDSLNAKLDQITGGT